MHQRITLAIARVGEIGHRAEHLPGGIEGDLDRVIHAAARHRFQPCAVGAHAPDSRGKPLVVSPFLCVDVEPVSSVGEVQPALRPEERSMQARCAAREPARSQHLAHIGHAVTVGVTKPPDIRW